MHPRQASLAAEVDTLMARIAVAPPTPTGQAVLWKYADPEGNTFYLEVKKTTVKSPFSGKSFSARPVKHTPAQVGKEMKDERKEQDKTASLVDYVDRYVSAGQAEDEAREPVDEDWDDSPADKSAKVR